MSRVNDLTNKKFNRLAVIERADDKLMSDGRKRVQWLCKCDCGNTTTVLAFNLTRNHTKSCGCLQKEKVFGGRKTHGLSTSRLYRIYNKMKDRCYGENNPKYKNYGERGITIYCEWLSNFQTFYDWSMDNGYADNLTIDRIDNDKGYEPNNCRWVGQSEQQNNRRNNVVITHDDKTHTLAEWSRILNMSEGTIQSRLRSGWSVKQTFEMPIANNSGDKKRKTKERFITYGETTKNLTGWAKEYGIPYKTLHARLQRGWDFEKSVETPLKNK